MIERMTPILRIACLVLAGVLTFQLSRLAGRAQRTNAPAESLLATPRSPTATGTASAIAIADGVPASAGASTNPPLPPSAPIQPRGRGPEGASPGGPPLPPAIQARIDRIVQSEVLGPIIRPLPMALLGIAGRDAFVRAPDGRVGLLREGEELGGMKMVRIGTNRVLIEHEQRRKELMLFSGFGSEPLLSQETKEPK